MQNLTLRKSFKFLPMAMSCASDNAKLIHTCNSSATFPTFFSEISKLGMGGKGLHQKAESLSTLNPNENNTIIFILPFQKESLINF